MSTSQNILALIAALAFTAILFALPVQLLWNYCVVPAIDGIHEIGFFQALGLNALTSIMFKSYSVKKD